MAEKTKTNNVVPKKKKSKKLSVLMSDEETKLVEQLRAKREQLQKLKKEMEALEKKIHPLAARRVAKHRLKAAGISEEDIAALKE